MAKKEKNIVVKKGAPEYMNTYGDLVTLLLCFFVLLFASSNIDAEKFKAIAASMSSNPISIMEDTSVGILDSLGNGIVEMPEVEGESDKENNEYEEGKAELEKMASDFRTYFAQNNYMEKIDVEQNDQYVILNFKDGILFDNGKAELKEEAKNALNIVADELQKYPENDIKIEGHTDNKPIHTVQYPSNWYLSAARAISVAEYFTNVKNIQPERLSTEGYGEYKPKVPNDTPENMATNRRVEIKISSKYYSNDAGS